MKHFDTGIFTISLDFELHWGVSENRTVESYRQNLENTPSAILRMLYLFQKNTLHVTWSTVGMLFCVNKNELLELSKTIKKPEYTRKNLSNYDLIEQIGLDESDDPYHYASSLIKRIVSTPHQEIGTHTFSHFYCLENGQNIENFREDITAALTVAKPYGVHPQTIVFPRNQYNSDYTNTIHDMGLLAYRGNPRHWSQRPTDKAGQTLWVRLPRALDTYTNITGHNTYKAQDMGHAAPYNIVASRFLRPYDPRLKVFESLKLHRIKSEMTYAAKNKELYHLWWHPHNFGKHLNENMIFLQKIVDHYLFLKKKYHLKSQNMLEIAQYLSNKPEKSRNAK